MITLTDTNILLLYGIDQTGGSAHILSSVCMSTCTFGICASTVKINQCVTQWLEIDIVKNRHSKKHSKKYQYFESYITKITSHLKCSFAYCLHWAEMVAWCLSCSLEVSVFSTRYRILWFLVFMFLRSEHFSMLVSNE